jgi:hypothetical protein
MPKRKVNVQAMAETSNSMAHNTLAQALVTSVVVDVMIAALVETGAIGRDELDAAFNRGLAFLVRQLPGLPSDDMKGIVLSTYRDVAAGHGAVLKPTK